MAHKMTQEEWQKSVSWVGVVAGCVIKKGNKILLVQEKQQRVYGLWNLPAGYVDKDETIEQAAVREALEETGYAVKVGKEIGVFHEAINKPVKHAFNAEITGGVLKIQNDEILDAQWLSKDEVKALKDEGKLRADWVWQAIELSTD